MVIGAVLLAATAVFGPRLLHRTDEALYNAFVGREGEPVRLSFPGDPPRMQKVLMTYRMPHYPEVAYVYWDTGAEPGSADASRAKMQELATILHCLNTRNGIRRVGVSSPLTWQDEQDEMARVMLSSTLESLQGVTVGLRGYNAAQAQETPKELMGSVFAAEQVEGYISRLPSANHARVFQLPIGMEKSFVVVPDYVEDELLTEGEAQQRHLSVPLLVKWNDRVWPTLPLRVAMEQLGLKEGDVLVKPGKAIRLGKRTLPLDVSGRTPLGAARARALDLKDLLGTEGVGQNKMAECALIVRPQLHSGEERAQKMAHTLSLLLAEEKVTYLPGMRPESARVLVLNPLQRTVIGQVILGVLIGVCLLGLPRLPRLFPGLLRSTLLLAGIAGFWLLSWLWLRHGMWMSLSTWALCWIELLAYQWSVMRNEETDRQTH